MAQANSMKQMGSRVVGGAVERMEWSNKMDLIAYGTDRGEVIIQRLNWQKIVTFPSLGEDIAVRSLGWQLDETVLAAGYSDGRVTLLDAEREDQISMLHFEEDIKRVYFSKAIKTSDYRSTYRNRTEHTFDFFLPPLPPLSGIGSLPKSPEEQRSFAKGSPCFLVVITLTGKVHLLLLGALRSGQIDLKQHVVHPQEFTVHDVRLSGNFNAIYALVSDGNELKVLHFHNKVLQEYISPMLHLAVHCANVLETKNYINETIQCIMEAWETVLLEMDNKLTKYAHQQPEGSISADFLELLVFGYATHEIENFLRDDLTEKGLKKLANSIDLSYSTVESLVTKQLQSSGVNMFYFLNSLKGLSRISYFFEPLLSCDATQAALRECGSFLMKVLEMQQVIDQCVNDMKLFFSWLCIVILRLHQHDIPEEMTQITPEDTIYLAEYLNSFEDSVVENEDGTVTKRKFNLEKVGQYLENRNLQQIVKSDPHHLWHRLLDENECLRNCSLLFPHEKESSLIQQRDKLLEAVENVFKRPNESISAGFVQDASITCALLPTTSENAVTIHSSFFVNDEAHTDLLVTTISYHELLLMEFNKNFSLLKCTRLDLLSGPFTSDILRDNVFDTLRFVDLGFYNESILSLLLKSNTQKDDKQSYFLQLALEATKGKQTQHIMPNNINLMDVAFACHVPDLMESNCLKPLEGECTHLAVSGSRKVVTVLSDQCRKMTIFEMEIEDDEDETEMSQNSLLEISKESVTSSNE
ncbi:anaphase-promoting complex subunit 4-like [Rhagoletis pomonella]|uniref:anaphase-promoting complex subunit 4-like n=1 Tax=Rhagoletis pomonella TaxID=28610 RepID=UPI0017870026|nr:anaphase-promoting complex subunit 4-like [Rhagoletis pomonella]